MKRVFKYELSQSTKTLEIPGGARIVNVNGQNGVVCLWAIVDSENSLEKRTFQIYGTGHPIEDDRAEAYVGTAHVAPFVWHVFELL